MSFCGYSWQRLAECSAWIEVFFNLSPSLYLWLNGCWDWAKGFILELQRSDVEIFFFALTMSSCSLGLVAKVKMSSLLLMEWGALRTSGWGDAEGSLGLRMQLRQGNRRGQGVLCASALSHTPFHLLLYGSTRVLWHDESLCLLNWDGRKVRVEWSGIMWVRRLVL